MTGRDLCTAALQELGVYGPTDTPSAEDLTAVLGKLNRLLDNWNAERQAVYTILLPTYVLTPNHQPHTIGPSGADFAVTTQRPVSVDAANLILTNVTPNVRIPLDLLDDQGWFGLPVPAQTGTIPIALYYSPDWPNGSIYLWPVPTVAYTIELSIRIVLAQVTLDTDISLPPGYLDAITLTTAESLLGLYPRRTVAETLIGAAAKARGRIFANNDVTPSIRTRDSGMPGAGQGGENFDYLTRQFS